MRRYGFHTLPARSAALIALASKLPNAVLAELLNVHVHAA
jgi:hypothetical protein